MRGIWGLGPGWQTPCIAGAKTKGCSLRKVKMTQFNSDQVNQQIVQSQGRPFKVFDKKIEIKSNLLKFMLAFYARPRKEIH